MEKLFTSTDPLYQWFLMPLFIFVCRASDVSLGTLRNILLSKNLKTIVPFIGFVEVMIWLVAVQSVLSHVSNIAGYLAWGFGYAAGIYLGIRIDKRLGLGMQIFHIITHHNITNLLEAAAQHGFAPTTVDATGSRGPVKIVYLIIDRTENANVKALIQTHCPEAFYTIEDVKDANQGVFPNQQENKLLFYLKRLVPLFKK
ncbi:MAG TPA: DUF5698 domain-containing protein [Bacteroidia bacterium]|nr:DUF5698 domain-containing protein [Bacteroidia bacterium]